MFKLFLMLHLLLSERAARCSIVIDRWTPKGINLSDYCPKMDYCEEGTHVMCMYYDPNRIMGSRCYRPKNVTISPFLADKLVRTVNSLRSKVAQGLETGKNDEFLPRAYGMLKVSWDSELATFAQVLANQCLLKHDLCRATERFPAPGQAIALIRFGFDDWMPVKKDSTITTPGLTASKLTYAVTRAAGQWYRQKLEVTPDMIKSGAITPRSAMYLRMILNSVTHMGCGVSAFAAYAHYTNGAPLNYNNIEVVCNFSGEPKKGEPVYDTSPPTEVGFTINCGCPPGFDETEDCLCYEVPSNLKRENVLECSNEVCSKQSVVLLPIFTVEDAPAEKLKIHEEENEVEIPDLYPQNDIPPYPGIMRQPKYYRTTDVHFGKPPNVNENPLITGSKTQLSPKSNKPGIGQNINNGKSIYISHAMGNSASVISSLVNEAQLYPNRRQKEISTTREPNVYTVRNRYFKDVVYRRPYQLRTTHPSLRHILPRKESIFSRVPKFKLRRNYDLPIKPDVKPRKDFSSKKNSVQSNFGIRKEHDSVINDAPSRINITVKKYSENAGRQQFNHNYYLTTLPPNSSSEKDNNIYLISDKADDKLMTLLDKLEQEVKNIELDRNKKEIFYTKIRKIYTKVLGNPIESDMTLSDLEETAAKEQLSNKIINTHDDELREILNNEIGRKRYYNPYKQNNNFKSDQNHSFNIDNINIKPRTGTHCNHNDEIKRRHIINNNELINEGFYSPRIENNKRLRNEINGGFEDNHYDDLLSVDRRKYYQDKLDNLEKKIKKTRLKHVNEVINPKPRPVKPAIREEEPLRPHNNNLDLYMPDRARFLHGF